jgi:hypothetical protein
MNIDAGQVLSESWVNTTTITPKLSLNETHGFFDTQIYDVSNTTRDNHTNIVYGDHPRTVGSGVWRYTTYDYNEVFNQYPELLAHLSNSTLPNSQTATYITASQPASINWPIWMFAVVAGSLTLGTLIGPLIVGHVFRSVARFSVRKRNLFRSITALLWLL